MTPGMNGLVVAERRDTNDGEIVFFECGAIQLQRHNGTSEFLTESELETITDLHTE